MTAATMFTASPSTPRRAGLSKSRLMAATQCMKRLYLEVHRPELRAVDASMQARFDAGNRVGEVARSFYPAGRLIGHSDNLRAALDETRAALATQGDLILFEPAFECDGVLARADILFRQRGRYRLIEVKSSTSVKDDHLQDAAIQAWVLEAAGCPPESVSIAVVDSSFVYPGNGNYRGLLKSVDVTAQIADLCMRVPDLIAEAQRTLDGPEPELAVGKHCRSPYECPFLAHCDRDAPEFPLSILGRDWRLAERLAAMGYRDLRDVPDEAIGDGMPRRLWDASRTGEVYIDPSAGEALRRLPWPRYYLDFETIAFAVPIWPGTRPYEQLPFQWSCHVEHADGSVEHREFLDTSGDAPMAGCMKALISVVGTDGPIFAYSGFENRVLREAAARHPELQGALEGIGARIVDLLRIVKASYYHPEQKGSWSIKEVLPTVAPELGYDALGEVADGQAAQMAYLEMIDSKTMDGRKQALAFELRTYCANDTAGMIRIAAAIGMVSSVRFDQYRRHRGDAV